jgi:uncharacterized membrane protein YecN with MAPEG domain
MTNPVPATALYGAMNVLLTVLLAARISQLRLRYRVRLGDGEHKDLQRAIRAHGNNVEWLPLGLLLLLIAELSGAAAHALHAVGGLLFLGRLGHAAAWSFGVPAIGMPSAAVNYLVTAGLAIWVLVLRGGTG